MDWKRIFAVAALAALMTGGVLVGSAGSNASGRTVSLDADDANLPQVLKILAEKGDLNVITGPGVATGKITLHMKDVPIDQAVNLVVRAAGLAYERIGNSILVADAKSLKEETGLSAYVVSLRYADAIDVKAALHGLTDQIEVDRGGNRLIIVTSPRVISEVEEIVAELDKPARQVMLEARVIEVSTTDAKKLGVDWDLLNRQGLVFIEGNYTTTTSLTDPSKITGLQTPQNTPGTDDVWRLRNFSRLPLSFAGFLDLMVQNGSAKVLASPKLATLNGKTASMLVGQRIPFVVSQTVFAGSAAAPTQSVQKEEVGVKLSITPLINADGYITTTVTPEVSSVTGYNGQYKDLPVISTRTATTTVRMRDSSTVIIGGLLSNEQNSQETRLPVLGSLPLFGSLFRHVSGTGSKTDLVIEITPHILPEQR